jgi:hypothetical protein
MATEWLVCARNSPIHSDLARRFFYAQGEVIEIKQAPAVWCRYEDPRKSNPDNLHIFWILTVDVTIRDPRVQQFREEGIVDVASSVDPKQRTRFSKRRWFIDVAALPDRVRNELRDTKRARIDLPDLAEFDAAGTQRTAERTTDMVG